VRIHSICKDCEDRYPGCHDHCEQFKQSKREYEAEKEIVYKERAKVFDWLGYEKAKARKLRGKK